MKKILSIILVLILVLGMVPFAFAEDCPEGNHVWAADWTVTPATCTTKGSKTRACTVDGCSATQIEEIAALGHTWGDWTVETAATCTAKGSEKRTCTVAGCGATETRDIEALGHAWGEWVVYTPATSTTTGLKMRVCSRDSSHTESEVIPVITSYAISTLIGGEGGGTTTGGATYNAGATAVVEAIPAGGYHFVNWTENNQEVSTLPKYSFTVNSDRTLVANFAKDAVTYSIYVTNNGYGSVYDNYHGKYVPSGTYVNVPAGANITFSFYPNNGYYPYSVKANGYYYGSRYDFSFSNVTANKTLYVRFESVYYHPATGDDSNVALFSVLALSSLVCLAAVVIVKKRSKV